MTREEAINEINKVFTSAYANYIVTALTEGATVSDIQHRWGRTYEAGVKDGLEQEPCEDAVSRKAVHDMLENLPVTVEDKWFNWLQKACMRLAELSPVTPQKPNTWSLDDAREDFMYDVYNELNFLPTNEEANRIIDSFDRVTSSIEQECKWIPVTEGLPKKEGLYLVSVKNEHNRRYSKTCWYSNKNWFARQDVVAWQPLPEPYKTESEGKE